MLSVAVAALLPPAEATARAGDAGWVVGQERGGDVSLNRWPALRGGVEIWPPCGHGLYVYNWMIYVPNMPAGVQDYLMPDEDVVVAVRRHPIVILFHAVLIVLGLVAVLWLTTGVTSSKVSHLLIWLLFIVLVAWAAWQINDWRLTYFVITENRLMLVSGVIGKEIAMMPLAKVTDMRLERSPLARTLGYGTFVIESAGQEQALRNVSYVPYAKQLYQEILAMIFPKKSPARPGDDSGY